MKLPTDNGPSVKPLPTWAGKAEAQRALETPFQGTLLPVEPYGEGAPHIFIQGESLEVLKILLKSYAKGVRMIWADPPSLLREDPIYPDDLQDPLKVYWQMIEEPGHAGLPQSPPEGLNLRLDRWLSMLYPRLYIARDLLQDDGLIFACVDHIGLPYLRLLMDDLFEIDNYLTTIVWQKSAPEARESLFKPHINLEYILAYTKEKRTTLIPESLWTWEETGGSQEARRELLNYVPLQNPINLSAPIKPTGLIRHLLEIATPSHPQDFHGDIVLDLFAGYGTTAQAVVEQNIADDGHRRAILISFPQPLPEPEGDFISLADVVRIRFLHVTQEAHERGGPHWERFLQAFELAPSNFENWSGWSPCEREDDFEKQPAEAVQHPEGQDTRLIAGWTFEGVLNELVLRYGYGFDYEVELYPEMAETQILLVIDSLGAGFFTLCLDDEIPLEAVQQIHLDDEDCFICRREALDEETAALLVEACWVKFI